MDISKEIAIDLVKLQQIAGLESTRVPVLVGKTSSGKTYWIQNELSKIINLPVVKILLQHEQADEILGYPRYIEETKALSYLKPAWWTDKPSIFFFDELDKAKEDLHASILTLLREGTLRGRHLPKGSVIICAMNEDQGLSDPLKARCAFLPFEYNTRDIQDTKLSNIAEHLSSAFNLTPELPDQVETMETIHFLEHYQTINPNLLQDIPKLRALVFGLFPEKYQIPILVMLSNLKEIDYVKLLNNNSLFNNFIGNINALEQAHKHFIECLKIVKGEEQAAILLKLPKRFASSHGDELVTWYKLVHDALMNEVPNIANHTFHEETMRYLGRELGYVLSKHTDVIDEMNYDWREDNAKSTE